MLFEVKRPAGPLPFDAISAGHAPDEEVERALRYVAARVKPPRVQRIRLEPRPGEVGPACATCADPLDRAQALVACPRCLGASHPECWPAGERCHCERPRPRGVGFRPR